MFDEVKRTSSLYLTDFVARLLKNTCSIVVDHQPELHVAVTVFLEESHEVIGLEMPKVNFVHPKDVLVDSVNCPLHKVDHHQCLVLAMEKQ